MDNWFDRMGKMGNWLNSTSSDVKNTANQDMEGDYDLIAQDAVIEELIRRNEMPDFDELSALPLKFLPYTSRFSKEQQRYAAAIISYLHNKKPDDKSELPDEQFLFALYKYIHNTILYKMEKNFNNKHEMDIEFEHYTSGSNLAADSDYITAIRNAYDIARDAVIKELIRRNEMPNLIEVYTSRFSADYQLFATNMKDTNRDLSKIYNAIYQTEVKKWKDIYNKADFYIKTYKNLQDIFSDPDYANMSKKDIITLRVDQEITSNNAPLKAIDAVIDELHKQVNSVVNL